MTIKLTLIANANRLDWPLQGLMLQKRFSKFPSKMLSHHEPLVPGLTNVRILCCWPTPHDREQELQDPHSVQEQFLWTQSAPTQISSPSGIHERKETILFVHKEERSVHMSFQCSWLYRYRTLQRNHAKIKKLGKLPTNTKKRPTLLFVGVCHFKPSSMY